MADIDWVDVGLHCLIAGPWAGVCGYAAGWGYGYAAGADGLPDAVLGWAIALGSVGAVIAGLLFWVARERKQHHYGFGGLQSFLEWIVPAGVTVLAFGAGFVIA